MKKYCLPLLFGLLLLGGCGSSMKDQSYTLQGTLTDSGFEGRTVFLKDGVKGTIVYDSAQVSHGKFVFTGRQDTIVVRELYVQQNDSDAYPLTIPVVLEPGEIQVTLGDIVAVKNTPLNNTLMEFLLAKDQFMAKDFSDKEVADVKKEFSELLVAWIAQNVDNAVGKYIYEAYSNKLDAEQKMQMSKFVK